MSSENHQLLLDMLGKLNNSIIDIKFTIMHYSMYSTSSIFLHPGHLSP